MRRAGFPQDSSTLRSPRDENERLQATFRTLAREPHNPEVADSIIPCPGGQQIVRATILVLAILGKRRSDSEAESEIGPDCEHIDVATTYLSSDWRALVHYDQRLHLGLYFRSLFGALGHSLTLVDRENVVNWVSRYLSVARRCI